MAGNWRILVGFWLALLWLSGCSYMPDMFWSDDEADITGYIEPRPGKSLDLIENWDRGIEGSPDDYMSHPRQIAVTEKSVFVGTYDGDVVRVDRASGSIVWRVGLNASVVGGVAVDEERVFAGTVEGEMMALSRQSGSQVWRAEVSTKVASAPLVAEGRVIFTTLNNRTYALNATNGDRLWTHSSVPMVLVVQGAATPTTDGRAVYIGYSTGEVFALSLDEGKVLWGENLSRMMGRSELDRLQDVDAEVVIGAASSDIPLPMIYTVNHKGSVVALHPGSGSPFWKHKFSAIRRPLLWGKQLFISDGDGQVVSMSAEDGLEVWRVKISDGTLTAPVRLGNQLIVGDDRGRLISMDPTSGRVMGMNKLGDPIIADPVVDGSNLYIWTNDGDLISFSVKGL
ncbi:MAG: outer membrane protein assembly factor BamB [Magnetococcales bacterium]|nr:outer membrane protein assembly factor BamB [Magnetococcales bacterium]